MAIGRICQIKPISKNVDHANRIVFAEKLALH